MLQCLTDLGLLSKPSGWVRHVIELGRLELHQYILELGVVLSKCLNTVFIFQTVLRELFVHRFNLILVKLLRFRLDLVALWDVRNDTT